MPATPKERQRLVDDNLSFVRAIAAKLKENLPRQIEFEDLVAYGMRGLLEAADRFDARHGTAFTTFAFYRVRGAMFDGLRAMGWIPRGEYRRIRLEERTTTFLQNVVDRETGAGASLDFNLEGEIEDLAEALGGVAAIYITSLDALRESQEPREEPFLPDDEVEVAERTRIMKSALDSLPEKERRLLELYYYEDRSLEEAGQLLGLSKSWASRLHARAVQLLEDALAEADYEPDEGTTAPKKRRARR